MKLEEAKEFFKKKITVNNAVIKEARKNGDINLIEVTNDLDTESEAIKTVLQALDNSISKDKVKEQLEIETERFNIYKKESEENENLRGTMWHHMGAKNMCERLLGIEKLVTLD